MSKEKVEKMRNEHRITIALSKEYFFDTEEQCRKFCKKAYPYDYRPDMYLKMVGSKWVQRTYEKAEVSDVIEYEKVYDRFMDRVIELNGFYKEAMK